MLVEHLSTGVYGRGAALLCQVAAATFIYWITTLNGDAVFQYASVIDRPVPLEVAYHEERSSTSKASRADCTNDARRVHADPDTWTNLLTNPPD